MIFLPISTNEKYLKLAVKVIADRASSSEKAELEKLLNDNPDLDADYQGLKQELLEDADDDLAELMIKSLVGKPTPEDHEKVYALRGNDFKRWQKFLAFALTLQIVAESIQEARKSPPTKAKMPDHVRERLTASLRKSRGK
jgi:hypothetical protein